MKNYIIKQNVSNRVQKLRLSMDCMEWYVDAKKLQLEAYRMNYEKLQTTNN